MDRDRTPRRVHPRRARRARWDLEPLEPRTLMAVFNVNSTLDILKPPAGTITLRSAIQGANAAPGPNFINLTVAGTYKITTIGTSADNSAGQFGIRSTTDLTIRNTSGGAATVDGGGLNRVFSINPSAPMIPFTVTLQGFTITRGVDYEGGGIDVNGAADVVLNQVTLTGNVGLGLGGGLMMEMGSTGSLKLIGSTVDHNVSDFGGGLASQGSGAIAIQSGSVVDGNTASSDGGGVFNSTAPIAVTGSVLSDNVSHGMGGGIASGGPVTVTASIIEGNVAADSGGGLRVYGILSVASSFVLDNVAQQSGGGIYCTGPTILLTNSVLRRNVALQAGGGLFAENPDADPGSLGVRINGSIIADNTAKQAGGGVEARSGVLTMAGSTVERNYARTSGGGLDLVGLGGVTIVTSLFRDNIANGEAGTPGGAISASGTTLAVAASRFTGNAAFQGGALYFSGSAPPGGPTVLAINSSTFDNNRSLASGGALYLSLAGVTTALANDTFASNAAGGYGGGLFLQGVGGALTLTDDTISGNTAGTRGGGFEQDNSTILVRNTIIAGNSAAGTPSDFSYVAGSVTDGGGDLLGVANATLPTAFVGDPKLGPLLDNGGAKAGAPADRRSVPTESLRPGSPAFGRGVVGAGIPAVDARGFGRPGGGAAKPAVGAYEPQYAANATANQVFAEAVYEVLFNRIADPVGLAGSVAFLKGGGTPTGLVQILQTTTESYNNQVIALYNRYLGRAPAAFELSAVAGALKGGASPETMAAALIGTAEFAGRYGNNNDVFVEGAFQATPGRTTDSPGETAAWGGLLTQGWTRQMFGGLLVTTQAYVVAWIEADFRALLGRPPAPSEMAAFLNVAAAGVSRPALQAIILGSSFAGRT